MLICSSAEKHLLHVSLHLNGTLCATCTLLFTQASHIRLSTAAMQRLTVTLSLPLPTLLKPFLTWLGASPCVTKHLLCFVLRQHSHIQAFVAVLRAAASMLCHSCCGLNSSPGCTAVPFAVEQRRSHYVFHFRTIFPHLLFRLLAPKQTSLCS